MLQRLFLSLQRCVSELGRDPAAYDDLITTALAVRFRPVPADAVAQITQAQQILAAGNVLTTGAAMCTLTTVNAYCAFARLLVASNPVFLHSVSKALVRALLAAQAEGDAYARVRAAQEAAATGAAGSSDGVQAKAGAPKPASSVPQPSASSLLLALPLPIAQELSTVLSRFNGLIYGTLSSLLSVVPTGANTLFSSITEGFPHKRLPQQVITSYARHALCLSNSIPQVRDRVLAALVDRMVDIDVDIQLELLPDADDEDGDGGGVDGTVAAADAMAAASAAAGSRPTSPTLDLQQQPIAADPGEAAAVATTVAAAAKLDALCLLVLRYVHGMVCSCRGTHGPGSGAVAATAGVAGHAATGNPPARTRRRSRNESITSTTSSATSGMATSDDTGTSNDDDDGDGTSSMMSSKGGAGSAQVNHHINHQTAQVLSADQLYNAKDGCVRPLPDPVFDADAGARCVCMAWMLDQARRRAVGVDAASGGDKGADAFTGLDAGADEADGTLIDQQQHTALRSPAAAASSNSSSVIPPHPAPLASSSADGRTLREHMFALMLGVFERSVLLTHRSKFVQFLLFYTCSLDPGFTDRFVGRLVTHMRNSDKSPLMRATAAAYLGSFLARSSTVDDTTVRSALYFMLEWAHGYCDLWEAHASHSAHAVLEHRRGASRSASPVDCVETRAGDGASAGRQLPSASSSASSPGAASMSASTGDVDQQPQQPSTELEPELDYQASCPGLIPLHPDPSLPPLPPPSLLHSILQSALYVVCFRAAEMRQLAGGLEYLSSLQWGRLLSSPLDPLAHCSEAVAREFVRVAHVLRLAPRSAMAVSEAYDRLTTAPKDDDEVEEEGAEEGGDASGPVPGGDVAPGQTSAVAAAAGATSTTLGASGAHAAVGVNTDARVLESFFPFDPFLLRESSRYVSPAYRSWNASCLGENAGLVGDWTDTEGYDTHGSLIVVGGAGAGAQASGYRSSGGASRTGYRSGASASARKITAAGAAAAGATSASEFSDGSVSGSTRKKRSGNAGSSSKLGRGGGDGRSGKQLSRVEEEVEDEDVDDNQRAGDDDDDLAGGGDEEAADAAAAAVDRNDDNEAEEDEELDNEDEEDEDGDGAAGEEDETGSAIGPASGSVFGAGAGGLLSRMRAGLGVGGGGHFGLPQLAPGLQHALETADQTDGLLAGLDLDYGDHDDGNAEDNEEEGEGDESESMMSDGRDGGNVNASIALPLPGQLGGDGVGGSALGRASNANRLSGVPQASLQDESSPSVTRLRSKMRGLSVDESAYYLGIGSVQASAYGFPPTDMPVDGEDDAQPQQYDDSDAAGDDADVAARAEDDEDLGDADNAGAATRNGKVGSSKHRARKASLASSAVSGGGSSYYSGYSGIGAAAGAAGIGGHGGSVSAGTSPMLMGSASNGMMHLAQMSGFSLGGGGIGSGGGGISVMSHASSFKRKAAAAGFDSGTAAASASSAGGSAASSSGSVTASSSVRKASMHGLTASQFAAAAAAAAASISSAPGFGGRHATKRRRGTSFSGFSGGSSPSSGPSRSPGQLHASPAASSAAADGATSHKQHQGRHASIGSERSYASSTANSDSPPFIALSEPAAVASSSSSSSTAAATGAVGALLNGSIGGISVKSPQLQVLSAGGAPTLQYLGPSATAGGGALVGVGLQPMDPSVALPPSLAAAVNAAVTGQGQPGSGMAMGGRPPLPTPQQPTTAPPPPLRLALHSLKSPAKSARRDDYNGSQCRAGTGTPAFGSSSVLLARSGSASSSLSAGSSGLGLSDLLLGGAGNGTTLDSRGSAAGGGGGGGFAFGASASSPSPTPPAEAPPWEVFASLMNQAADAVSSSQKDGAEAEGDGQGLSIAVGGGAAASGVDPDLAAGASPASDLQPDDDEMLQSDVETKLATSGRKGKAGGRAAAKKKPATSKPRGGASRKR